ncbi:MAG: dihydropyrimidinase [Proteobacteria bacterium]|nr:dihydropyrimidinase [Pseudomonadota bacterium]MDA1355775.1 dihydropyrimidinase [Pseudomonadota bacterium]
MDLILRNGSIVTHAEEFIADIGIEGGKIKQIGHKLGPAAREIDVSGKYLFPGGVDAHTHVDFELMGKRTIDDFHSSTVQAACGGVTTVIDYVFPAPGQTLMQAVESWKAKAKDKTVIDYGLHPTLFKPDDQMIQEMGDLVAEGHTSFKIFMTELGEFDQFAPQYVEAMHMAGKLGALTNIHCEDQCCISYITKQLETAGKSNVKHFADSRPRISEGLAAHRACALARVADAPVYLVHLSCEESMDELNDARAKGQTVYGETRPIYLHLDRERFNSEVDPERYVGWPPLREASQMDVLWQALDSGVLQTVATDHVGWSMEQKKEETTVDNLQPGMSNLETVMPMLYSEGIGKGRMSRKRFVEVISTNPAKIFGLYPQKGTIAIGSDADIVVFDPKKDVTIRHEDMHSNQDWELHEGFEVTGWPVMTLSRGEIIVENGNVLAKPGRGKMLRRQKFAEL